MFSSVFFPKKKRRREESSKILSLLDLLLVFKQILRLIRLDANYGFVQVILAFWQGLIILYFIAFRHVMIEFYLFHGLPLLILSTIYIEQHSLLPCSKYSTRNPNKTKQKRFGINRGVNGSGRVGSRYFIIFLI
jgi:hypothetical protein